MKTIKSLVGQKFGKLTVIQLSEQRGNRGQVKWLCRCDCGAEKTIASESLKSGNSQSCGCGHRGEIGDGTGSNGHRQARRWRGMIKRCYSPSCRGYKDYGARGIRVCDRWHTFTNFIEDVDATYFPGASLDRIDNNGHYEPSNVRWATHAQQNLNTRRNTLVSYKGERLTVLEWCRRLNHLNYATLSWRIRNGWPDELAIGTPTMIRPETFMGGPTLRPRVAKSK